MTNVHFVTFRSFVLFAHRRYSQPLNKVGSHFIIFRHTLKGTSRLTVLGLSRASWKDRRAKLKGIVQIGSAARSVAAESATEGQPNVCELPFDPPQLLRLRDLTLLKTATR